MIVLRSLRAACIAWAAGAALSASAATLTTVPMQGSMVMPMMAYHASDGSLTVQVDPTIPQLTPLLVSNPGDSFNPGDPWYDYLDPSRQGLAFSRRYGFVMGTMSDPLPPGTAIWIRKVSSSLGLGAYRCRSSSPKLWEPIFGTGGVTNTLYWDGTMFHPAFTALPGTGTFTATFEAFLLNTADGTPVPGANTGPFTLNWTVVPDGRPALCIAQRIVVGWPPSATNYVLEAADTLPASSWTTVTNIPVLLDSQMAVIVEPSADMRFFRMRLAP
jgi:hypothetical protein